MNIISKQKGAGTLGVVLLVVILLMGALVYFVLHTKKDVGAPQPVVTEEPTEHQVATAFYSCGSDMSIAAAFSEKIQGLTVATDAPQTPTGSVTLSFKDGRTVKLPQTISADGARYATSDDATVFWGKGRGALFSEGASSTPHMCIEVTPDPGNLPTFYASSTAGISLRYGSGYIADEAYSYNALGKGKNISGVKFTVPEAMATGTNLSSDSYISVEHRAESADCVASAFLGQTGSSTISDGDMTYSFATSSDAAAGNRYEEIVYALPGTAPCIAVRYFIHYGVFENYASGTVTAFDKNFLLEQFDMVRRTLVVAQ